METGRIDSYFWYDLGEVSLRESLRRLGPSIVGLEAINTSFDSGLLSPDYRAFPAGWATHGGAAVSPPITDALIAAWPLSHDQYCDQWWFFKHIPAEFDVTRGICNYVSCHIGDWAALEFEGGAQLAKNIARFRPEAIVGNNDRAYCVSRCWLGALAENPKSRIAGPAT
jgi:hypothetical protein